MENNKTSFIPFTEEQLRKVQKANLTMFDPETFTFTIKKFGTTTFNLEDCFLVKLSSSVVNNPETSFSSNWNAGSYPTHEYMLIYVNKMLGDMLQIEGIAFDFETKQTLNYKWSGWLPMQSMQILAISKKNK